MATSNLPARWWHYRGAVSLVCVIVALAIAANGVKELASPPTQLGRDQLDDHRLNERDVSVACDSIEQAGELVSPAHRLEGETVTQQVYLCRIADRVLPMTANEPPASPVEGILRSLYSGEITWPDAFKRDHAMSVHYLQVTTGNLIMLGLSLALGSVALGFVALWSVVEWRRRRQRTARQSHSSFGA